MKPISFRPQELESALISELLETGRFKDVSVIIRNALKVYAEKELGTNKFQDILVEVYK